MQKPIAREAIGPSGEVTATVLLNGEAMPTKALSNDSVYAHRSVLPSVSFAQRSSFLQWAAVTAKTHNESQY